MDGRRSIRGRGAADNPANRFDGVAYVRDAEIDDAEEPAPSTSFLPDLSRTILTRNNSPDIPYKTTLNPYRGCEHGCAYCYARPTHEYLGLSAGLDFETRIFVKEDAPRLLREALASPRWVPQPVWMSGVTDCYQPVERRLQLTRRCLEVFAEFRNPVALTTKNRLVMRDIDVFRQLAEHRAVSVFLSLTTLDVSLNRILEPRTSLPAQRLAAIRELSAAGVPVGVLVAPVIPGLTDHELPALLEAAADAGAQRAGYTALRLPHAVGPIFEGWLSRHMPDRKEKVLNRIRALHGGRLYQSEFGVRMRGEGPFAQQIEALFNVAARRCGLLGRDLELSTEFFRRPGDNPDQLSLF